APTVTPALRSLLPTTLHVDSKVVGGAFDRKSDVPAMGKRLGELRQQLKEFSFYDGLERATIRADRQMLGSAHRSCPSSIGSLRSFCRKSSISDRRSRIHWQAFP